MVFYLICHKAMVLTVSSLAHSNSNELVIPLATYQLAALTYVQIANATVDSLGPHNLLPTITARNAIGR